MCNMEVRVCIQGVTTGLSQNEILHSSRDHVKCKILYAFSQNCFLREILVYAINFFGVVKIMILY